jgi:Protein of unknown function, DUF547
MTVLYDTIFSPVLITSFILFGPRKHIHLQRLAFFANLYNAMIIHALCQLGPPEDSPQGRSQFFTGRSGARYRIGGYIFSPDDIEHGILRGNYPHPSQVTADPLTSSPSFLPVNDPSVSLLALPYLDPRIHFILNCGASSCPPIKVLSGDPQQTELALATAARAYLTGEIALVKKRLPRFRFRFRGNGKESGENPCETEDIEEDVLTIPRLILWYGADFGKDLKTRLARLLVMVWDSKYIQGSSDSYSGADGGSIMYQSEDVTGAGTGTGTGAGTGTGTGTGTENSAYHALKRHLQRYNHSEIRRRLSEDAQLAGYSADSISITDDMIREYEAYLDSLVEYNVYNWAINSYE